MDKVNMVKNKNRREFFRIYEQADLLYNKIEGLQVADSQPVFNNILYNPEVTDDLDGTAKRFPLPGVDSNWPTDTDFKGNDARNVNISASGIAFTCEDELNVGDYLAMKIMLASGIKGVLTYARVVYCKANKESDSQPSSFVGAHFVNMRNEVHESLKKHVDKKRVQQTWVNGVILAIFLIVIAAPGAIFGLLLGLLHFVLELVLEFAHLGFEFIESNLDHLIEHLFETDLHQTQVIVFYIIFSVAVFGLYRAWRLLPRYCLRLKKNQLAFWSRKKASFGYFWQEQSLFNKIRWVAIGAAIVTGYVFFGM